MKAHFIALFLFIIFVPISIKAQESVDSLNIYIKNLQFKQALRWIDAQEETKQNKFQKAMCYNALGENRKATVILEELSGIYPFDITIKKELAQCYEVASRWQKSAMVYTELANIDSTNIYFPIKKAESEINNKNIDTAIGGLKTTLSKDTLSSVLRLLAKGYEAKNDLDSTAYYYGLGWEIDSTDVFFATNFVNTCLKKKQYLAAYASAYKFIEIDSTSNQMNFLYGYSQYALEDYENAKKTLQKCYNAGDSAISVSRTLGMSYFFMGESDNSYKYLQRAYEMDTTNNTVLQHLAESANDIKKYDEGIVYFTKMLERLIPSKMKVYLNYRGLAIAYENSKKYYEAAQAYEKAIENATQDQIFYMLEPLAYIYYEHLDEKEKGLYYYRQYKSTLDGKLLSIKYSKEEKDYSKEIEDITKQIADIDVFINQIEFELSKGKTIVPLNPMGNPFLFVVNNEIVDFPPKGEYIRSRTIYKLDKASEEDLPLVELAKEKGKTQIVIIDMDIEEDTKTPKDIDAPMNLNDSLQALNPSTIED